MDTKKTLDSYYELAYSVGYYLWEVNPGLDNEKLHELGLKLLSFFQPKEAFIVVLACPDVFSSGMIDGYNDTKRVREQEEDR